MMKRWWFRVSEFSRYS